MRQHWWSNTALGIKTCRLLLSAALLLSAQAPVAAGLADSPSLYLRQHSNNPIMWQQWGALEQIVDNKDPDGHHKLIFISVGYSSCHWCHEMNRQTFSDDAVAQLLNSDFTPLLIDREARPDVDQMLQEYAAAIAGVSGWPLNVIANSEGVPLFFFNFENATATRHILRRYSDAAAKNPIELRMQASIAGALIQHPEASSTHEREIDADALRSSASMAILENWDEKSGAALGAPKFPSFPTLINMLQHYRLDPDPEVKRAVATQLDAMANHGLWDLQEGGFFRYSSSRDWSAPHFEKMLYTQGLAIITYANAAVLFDHDGYLDVALRTFRFLERHMRVRGGYGSAIDSEASEIDGGWYTIDPVAIERATAERLFSQGSIATMENGRWYRFTSMKEQVLSDLWHAETNKQHELLTPPRLDDKQIVGWNALISIGLNALSKNPRLSATIREEIKKRNDELLDYLYTTAVGENTARVARYIYSGEGHLSASALDTALLSQALLEADLLYENPRHRAWGLSLAEQLQSTYISKPRSASTPLASPRSVSSVHDTELPSAASQLLRALQFAGRTSESAEFYVAEVALKKQITSQLREGQTDTGSVLMAMSDPSPNAGEAVQRSLRGVVSVTLPEKAGACDTGYFDVQVRTGWKIAAPEQSDEDTLIPLTVTEKRASGLTTPTLQAPAEALERLSESGNVLRGAFRLSWEPSGNCEADTLQTLLLRVQACNDNLCLAPERLQFAMPGRTL